MKISQKGSKASPHCNTQMTVPIQQESLDSMYSFGEDFGSWLKHSHCRRLLFIRVLIKWASSTHICQASTIQRQNPLGPAQDQPVWRPFRILLGRCQEKRRRGRSERFMSYLLVCDTMCITGNSILTSVPPTLHPSLFLGLK